MTSEAEPPRRTGSILEGRARILLPIFLVAFVGISAYRLVWAPTPPSGASFSGEVMGTRWSVHVADANLTPKARASLSRTIEEGLDRIDGLMSTFRDDSELSRFNRADAHRPFSVAPETLEVFEIAREVSELSGGAFDVTVGPLVAAWGFGATDRIPAPPTDADLALARQRVGFARVEIGTGSLTKSRDDVACDLSAIAKGYAVDRVAAALQERGHRDFLVEVGGEVRANGRRLDGAVWRVAIERPDGNVRGIFDVIPLRDRALATSGDYRNYYEVDGRRFSHTIDPRSGRPIEHRLASVSVLHREAARADALATALDVLGPEAGYALAEVHGLAAYFIVRGADGVFTFRETPAFRRAREPDTPAPR
ncbi:MAG: FAD:protein FMN transferase [Planctomycetota bacterium]